MPRQRHVAKVAQSAPCGKSCTVSNCHVAKTMPNQLNSGAGTFFKQIFFFQGRNSKLAQISGTIIIFKPFGFDSAFWRELGEICLCLFVNGNHEKTIHTIVTEFKKFRIRLITMKDHEPMIG